MNVLSSRRRGCHNSWRTGESDPIAHIAAQMMKMAIGSDDVRWSHYKAWNDDTRYQAISLCRHAAVEKHPAELERQGVMRRCSLGVIGIYHQLLVIPKRSGPPRLTIDSRHLNAYTVPWVTAIPPVHDVVAKIPHHWRYSAA